MARGKFGEHLKRERELREVSLDELSKATRISNRFLQALENEDWAKLPGGVFGHGFVRSIARYLGLAEEALLGEYDLARAEHSPSPAPKPQEPIPSPAKWIPAAALLAFLLLAVGLILTARYAWRRLTARHAPARSSLSASPAQSPLIATSDPPRSPSEVSDDVPLDLNLSTSSAAHVRILADDKVLLDSDLPSGKTLRFTAKQRFDVSASNSSAVLLELNGKPMAPLGPPGASGRMVFGHVDLR
ncbi:MAG TPA: RodZ domain-containing protein [Candidatus Acidoferrum sp.]